MCVHKNGYRKWGERIEKSSRVVDLFHDHIFTRWKMYDLWSGGGVGGVTFEDRNIFWMTS